MRVGFFGGTFDPPHVGHVAAAKAAVRELSLDLLLVVPAGFPPKLDAPEQCTPAVHRLEMARLAFADVPNCSVSDMELTGDGPSYTVRSMETVARRYPGAELFLLFGSDAFANVQRWRGADKLFSLCTLVPIRRRVQDREEDLAEHAAELYDKFRTRTQILSVPPVEVDSTCIRQRMASRDPGVPPAVREYILRSGLYDAKL